MGLWRFWIISVLSTYSLSAKILSILLRHPQFVWSASSPHLCSSQCIVGEQIYMLLLKGSIPANTWQIKIIYCLYILILLSYFHVADNTPKQSQSPSPAPPPSSQHHTADKLPSQKHKPLHLPEPSFSYRTPENSACTHLQTQIHDFCT